LRDESTTETQRHREDVKWSIWVTGSLVLQGLGTVALLGLAAYSVILSVRHSTGAREYRVLALFSAFCIFWVARGNRLVWFVEAEAVGLVAGVYLQLGLGR
jgi:hypothetical protein